MSCVCIWVCMHVCNISELIQATITFDINLNRKKYYFPYLCCCCCFLGPHLQHMEVPRLRLELEPQLLAYTTARVMPDPSRICNLHHSPRSCQIFNPLSKARDGTHILPWGMLVWFVNRWAMTGMPVQIILEGKSKKGRGSQDTGWGTALFHLSSNAQSPKEEAAKKGERVWLER